MTLRSKAGTLNVELLEAASVLADEDHLVDAHLVSSQGTGLVGANDAAASKSLNRGQASHNRVPRGHLARTESQTCCNDDSQSFRNSGNTERDSDLKVVDSALGEAAMRGVVEVADVDEPDEDADGRDNLRELVAKVVQLLLERGGLRDLRCDALMDVSNRRVAARQNYQRGRMARNNRGAGEQHIDLILLDGALILDSPGILGHALALSGQDRLVDVEAVALDRQDPAVSGYPVANRDRDDISGNQLVGLDALDVAVAYDLGLVGRVFLEGGDGFLGAGFLRDSDDSVEDEDGEDLDVVC